MVARVITGKGHHVVGQIPSDFVANFNVSATGLNCDEVKEGVKEWVVFLYENLGYLVIIEKKEGSERGVKCGGRATKALAIFLRSSAHVPLTKSFLKDALWRRNNVSDNQLAGEMTKLRRIFETQKLGVTVHASSGIGYWLHVPSNVSFVIKK